MAVYEDTRDGSRVRPDPDGPYAKAIRESPFFRLVDPEDGTPAQPTEPLVSVAAALRAVELGVDLSQVIGSGPRGYITLADVEAKASQGGSDA